MPGLPERARRRGNIFPRAAGSRRDFPQPVCRVLPEPAQPLLRCWISLAVISSLGSCNSSGTREVTGAQVRAPARSCIRPAFPAQPYLAGPSLTPHFPPLPSFPHPAHPAALPAAGRGLGAVERPAGPLPADPGSAQIGNPAGAEGWEPLPSFYRGLGSTGISAAGCISRPGVSREKHGRREWRPP